MKRRTVEDMRLRSLRAFVIGEMNSGKISPAGAAHQLSSTMAAAPTELNAITLVVRNMERSVLFYEVLGFPVFFGAPPPRLHRSSTAAIS